MDEILKALAPWPMLQGIMLGLLVAAGGAWAMKRGFQDSKKTEPSVEDLQARWEMQKALAHIHENSFVIVDLLKKQNDLAERMLAALNRIGDNLFNIRQ